MRSVRVRDAGKIILVVLLAGGLFLSASPQKKKKKKEEQTQTLQLPRELPSVVECDPRNLTFYVTPLSSRGLLSRQVRDALTALVHEAKSNPILQIRAFVAGSGDARRVRDLVSEIFTERSQPLPALSLVQAGGLPQEGAQVVLEGIAAGRKPVNPLGLAFISAQTAVSGNPLDPVAPLVARVLAGLRTAVKAAGSEPADVLRVTCFLSSLDRLPAARQLVAADYPGAVVNFVQPQRAPAEALASCEAVARVRRNAAAPVEFLNPEGLPREPGVSQVALVASSRVVLTGSQVSFGYADNDARLAFTRLQKSLEQAGVSGRDVAVARYYPLATGIASQVRQVRGEFFSGAQPPAGSLLLFEGLPSMDAGFAMDAVAAKQPPETSGRGAVK